MIGLSRRRRLPPILLLCLCLCLCLVWGTGCTAEPSVSGSTEGETPLTVVFLDVGQADAALVYRGDAALLIDGGNNGDGMIVLEAIREAGLTRLDMVIGTHPHEDHIGGLDEVLSEIPVGTIILPEAESDSKTYRDLQAVIAQKGVAALQAVPGERTGIGGFSLDILAPVRAYADANNNSVLAKVTYGDTVFLFTGDMEAAAERDVLSAGADVSCDVLKAPHHGSETSSSYVFLRQSNPTHIVISCGEGNSYGHPHEEPLSRYRDLGATLYRTDTMGTIIMESDGHAITVNVQGQESDRPHTTDGGLGGDISVAAYIGNKNSLKFHLESCASLPAQHNRVLFDGRQAALETGYTPCGTCKP